MSARTAKADRRQPDALKEPASERKPMQVTGGDLGLMPHVPVKANRTSTDANTSVLRNGNSGNPVTLSGLTSGASPRTPGTPATPALPDLAVRFGNSAELVQPQKVRTAAATIGLFGELDDHPTRRGPAQDGVDNLRQITAITEGAIFDPEIDRTGKWLAVASTMHHAKSDLYLRSVGGTTFTQLTDDPANEVMPTFSPDSKQLSFASDRSGNWDIYVVPVSGGRPIQLTDDQAPELHPTWSPDGRTIAFCKLGEQSGRWEIWTVDLAQPGVKRFLIYGMFPQWNPDPAEPKLLFQRARERGSRFHSTWTVDYLAGEARNPTEIVSALNAATINPAWSPDGRRIVFVTVVEPENEKSDRPTQSDLWIVNADGTDRTALTGGKYANYQPVWASDGAIYFVSDRSGAENVWAVTSAEMSDFGRSMEIVSVDENAAHSTGAQP